MRCDAIKLVKRISVLFLLMWGNQSTLWAAQKADDAISPLLALPDEVQLHTLNFIPVKEQIKTVSPVSEHLHRMVMNEPRSTPFKIEYSVFNKKLPEKVTAEAFLKALLRPAYLWVDMVGFPLSMFQTACNILKERGCLKVLSFTRQKVDGVANKAVWQSLSELLRSPSLETAHLILGNLTIEEARLFGESLKTQAVSLKHLMLDIGEDPTGKKVGAIVDGLEESQSLVHLQFSQLYPSPEMFGLLPMPYLSYTIGATGISRLISYLENHPNLSTFFLESKEAPLLSTEEWIGAFKIINAHPSIKEIGLTIEDNYPDVDEALADLVKAKKIKVLELLSTSAVEKRFNLNLFAQALSASNLTVLCMNGVKFTNEAFNSLVGSIKDSSTTQLQVLQIADSCLSNNQIVILLEAIQQPSSKIEQITLQQTGILMFDEAKAKALEGVALQSPALEGVALQSPSLRKLSFGGIDIDIARIRQHLIEEQLAAFYNQFFPQLLPQVSYIGDFSHGAGWGTYATQKLKIPLTQNSIDSLGGILWGNRLPQEGIDFFSSIVELGGEISPVVHGWLGACYSAGQRDVEACQSFEKAFEKKIDSAYSFFYKLAAFSYSRSGDKKKCLEYYDIYAEKNPQITPAELFQLAHYHVEETLSLYAEEKVSAKNHLRQAAACYERGLSFEGKVMPSAIKEAAEVYYALLDWKKSAAYYTRYFASETTRIDNKTYINAAYAFFKDGDYQGANKYYDIVLPNVEGTEEDLNSKQYQEAGVSYLATREFKKAIACFKRVQEIDPMEKNLDLFVDNGINLATTYFVLGKYDLSLGEYNRVFNRVPGCPAFHYFSAAQPAIELKKWDEALGFYEEGFLQADALNDQELLPSAYANKGLIYFNLEDWPKACSEYDQAIQQIPGTPPARLYQRAGYTYAKLWLAQNKENSTIFEKAVTYLAHAAQLERENVTPSVTQGFPQQLAELLAENPEIKEKVDGN